MALSSVRRSALIVGGVLFVGLCSLLIFLSSPFFHTQLIGRAFAALEREYGIIGHTDQLDVGLARLDVQFRGLTLATREHPDEPFLTVDEARIDLPWSALWDEFAIQAVALTRPRLSVQVDTDGDSNLPTSSAPSGPPPTGAQRLPIGELSVQDLTLEWRDEPLGLRADVGPTTLSLTGDSSRIAGPIRLATEVVVDIDGQEIRVNGLEGGVSYDGATVGFEGLAVRAPEGVLTVGGEIRTVLSSPILDLTLDSTFDLPRLATWFDTDTVNGELVAVGTVVGPATNPTASLSVSSGRMAWDEVELGSLEGQIQVTTSAAQIETLTMSVAEGSVLASGMLSLSDDANSLNVEWDSVDADVLLQQLQWDVPSVLLEPTASGTLALVWTDLDPRSTTVALETRGVAPEPTGETRLDGQDGTFLLTVDQTIGGARLAGTADGFAGSDRWSEIDIGGELELTCADLAVCKDSLPPVPDGLNDLLAELGGQLAARLQLAGSAQAPQAGGAVVGTATGVGQLPRVDVAFDFAVDATAVELSSVDAQVGNNSAGGEVRLVWENSTLSGGLTGELRELTDFASLVPDGWTLPAGTVQFDADLAGTATAPRLELVEGAGTVTLLPLFTGTPDELPLGGIVTFNLSGEVVPQPDLAGELRADDLRWGDRSVGTTTVGVVYGEGSLGLEVEVQEFGLTGDLIAGLEGERLFSGSARVSSPDGGNLSRLGNLFDLPLSGELLINSTFAGSLDALENTSVRLELMLPDGRFGEQALSLRPPEATLRYDGEVLSIDELELQVGRSILNLSGRLTRGGNSTLAGRLSSSADDLLATLSAIPSSETWLPADIDAGGSVVVDVTAEGRGEALQLEGRLDIDDGRVALGGHPPVEQLHVRASYLDGVTEVEQLSARWQGASVVGQGTIPLRLWAESLPTTFLETLPPDSQAVFTVRVDSLTEDALVAYLDEATVAELQGLVSGTLEIEATEPTVDAVRATLVLEEAELSVSGIPLSQRRPTRLELEDGRLVVRALDFGNRDDYLTVGGTVEIDDEPVADLTVTGSLDLVALSAFTPGVAVQGQANLIADIRGRRSNLDVRGTVELADAGLRVAEPRLVISALNGALLLTGDTLTPFALGGQLNGGSIEVTGQLSRVDLRPEGTLTLTGQRVAMNVPQGLRTEIDADIDLIFAGGETTVSGTTTIQRGDYREPMSLAGGLLSTVDTRQQVRLVGLEEAGVFEAVQLDVQVITAEDIVLENNYLDALLTGNVSLGGTIGSPAVTGRVALLEGGRIRVGTRAYDIETGAIDLVDPTGIDPRVDIRARTRVSDYDITLSISGGQGDLVTSMQSDPALPERDIVSVLLTGQTLSNAAEDPGAAARNQALGLVSNELLGAAGREVGLDVRIGDEAVASGQVRFDSSLIAGERDPSSQLTVGTRLNDRVMLILSQDLREGGRSWIVSYLARSNLEVRGLFSEDNNRGYEFRHALDFGAPPSLEALRSTTAAQRGPVRIVEIRFSGSTGYRAEVLREHIRLRVGDIFDFHRWQEDQDRLQRFYTDRGFREVRITARRTEGATPTDVILEYEFDRGPLTRLAVEGFDLPGTVRAQLEQAWELSVFDGFLLEELQDLTRAHLRSRGYLQSQVVAEVTTPQGEAEKIIEVRITPGPHTDTRELAIVGNEAIDTERLRAFATAVFDEGGEWGDPASLEDALVRLYRSDGWLEASVTVAAVEFDGPLARLPVLVTEGRQFSITTVELAGVSARTESDARLALNVPTGTPYSDVVVSDALARLERSYRENGFNRARVFAESTVDTDRAEVALAVDVQEGRQEMLQEIVVDGATRTHPGLVSTALDLDIGTPVDLTSLNLARMRLYDTGVFRTVDLRVEETEETETEPTSPGISAVRARVLLEEWPTYSLRYGLRVNDQDVTGDGSRSRDFGLGLAVDASRRNLLGRGATVGAAVRAGDRGAALRGYFRIPRSFGLPIRSGVYAERSRADRGESDGGFTEDLTTFTFEQRVQLPLEARLTYSTNLDRNHSFEKEPSNPDFPFDIQVNIIRFASNVVLDRRDNLFDATAGWFHASHVEYGFEPGEGEITFAKYLAQQYHHWSVGRNVVLASAGRLGLATGLGDPLIPTERFFAGGGNSVRGYAQDSLGPKSIFEEAAGGNSMLILNQEIRFPVVWRIGAVGFVDAGNVFETAGDISFADLAVGTGVGLRLQTPVGLLRFDYGFALTREEGDPSGRWHFSIGQAF